MKDFCLMEIKPQEPTSPNLDQDFQTQELLLPISLVSTLILNLSLKLQALCFFFFCKTQPQNFEGVFTDHR